MLETAITHKFDTKISKNYRHTSMSKNIPFQFGMWFLISNHMNYLSRFHCLGNYIVSVSFGVMTHSFDRSRSIRS